MTGHSEIASQPTQSEARTVHDWRVTRLTKLGLPLPTADAVADSVDWHDVASLVDRGCPATLAVAILN